MRHSQTAKDLREAETENKAASEKLVAAKGALALKQWTFQRVFGSFVGTWSVFLSLGRDCHQLRRGD